MPKLVETAHSQEKIMFENLRQDGVFGSFHQPEERPDLSARFIEFVATFGWTQHQSFRAAYRDVRRAINNEDAERHYMHYLRTKQLPDYVLAFMNGDVATDGVWSDV